MNDRVIPLTVPGPAWSQREYIAAMRLGIGFAAHRCGHIKQWFHYAFPGDVGCTSVLIGGDNSVERYIDHPFIRMPDWPQCMSAAVEKEAVS